jgi:hypothetical protein
MSELRRLGARAACTVIIVTPLTPPTLVALRGVESEAATAQSSESTYAELVDLFADWRDFERPRFVDGVADYTAGTMAVQRLELARYRRRLAAIDPSA